jgi:DNA polymerase III epsilon subunit-like protein
MLNNTIQKAKYLLIDTETTGLFFSQNGLIQAAGLILDNKLNEIDRFCVDICPDQPYEISQESIEITGFTIERIQAGMSYQDFCEYFLNLLQNHFPDCKPILVAQFLPFDYSFLYSVFGKRNMDQELCDRLGNDFIDTKCNVNAVNLMAELRGDPIPFPSTSLSKPGGLKDKLGIDQSTFTAHDALGDCEATLAVLKKLIVIFGGSFEKELPAVEK